MGKMALDEIQTIADAHPVAPASDIAIFAAAENISTNNAAVEYTDIAAATNAND